MCRKSEGEEMIDYCKLVWKVKGFMFQKDDFRLDEGSFDAEEIFFEGETLSNALKGVAVKEDVWVHKYLGDYYLIFREEEEALEDAIDKCEDEKELKILENKLEELSL